MTLISFSKIVICLCFWAEPWMCFQDSELFWRGASLFSCEIFHVLFSSPFCVYECAFWVHRLSIGFACIFWSPDGTGCKGQGTRRRRAALADWTRWATMHSRKPIGDGLRKCVHTERGRKTHRKIHTKKEGVPLGNPLEKGTKIIPCMSRIKTSLVEVRDILVWELGQTCEAARNGTWKSHLKI